MAAIVTRKGSCVAYVGAASPLKKIDKLTNVYSFTTPQSQAGEIDVTDFDSEAKEFETGMIDNGEVTIVQNLVSSTQYSKMQTFCDSGTTIHFALFVKDKTGAVVVGRKGTGVVKSVNIEGAEAGDNKMTFTSTIRVSGAVTNITAEPTS
jgi:hypothetical protein